MRYGTAVIVWIVLLGLLMLSVTAAQLVSGPLLYLFTLTCAAAMSALILAAFMGLKSADGLVRLFALGGLLWLGFLLLLTLADTLAR